jgi:hypothetical protein
MCKISYFCNNRIIPRSCGQTDGIAELTPAGDVLCRMNGYAIIPLEKYYALIGKEMPADEAERVAATDAQFTAVSTN